MRPHQLQHVGLLCLFGTHVTAETQGLHSEDGCMVNSIANTALCKYRHTTRLSGDGADIQALGEQPHAFVSGNAVVISLGSFSSRANNFCKALMAKHVLGPLFRRCKLCRI
jgi:hypothetical protein